MFIEHAAVATDPGPGWCCRAAGAIITVIDQLFDWDVRPLRPEEVDDVAEALGLARLHQGDGFYLVAWAVSQPVGHAHLAFTDPPQLQDLEVRASHRRRGVASALIAAAEEEARARGFSEVCLEVSVGDEVVQALYRNRGYRDAGSPTRRVKGTIMLRTGPIEVDDELLLLSKRLHP